MMNMPKLDLLLFRKNGLREVDFLITKVFQCQPLVISLGSNMIRTVFVLAVAKERPKHFDRLQVLDLSMQRSFMTG
jgi:hypothetical protein